MKAKNKSKPRTKALITVVIILLIVAVLMLAAVIGTDKYLHYSYPKSYMDYVTRYSAEYKLDEYMVYAFIKTESSFNPDATSDLGARGLMQIMPETFDWIRYKLDEENDPEISFDSMFTPAVNIRYGCFLLSYLSDEFDGDITKIAAAYHAGAGSVFNWIEDDRYCIDGKLVEIPVPDTAHYVDKIISAYNMYCKLYCNIK